jgi:uncharacterized protein (TIGR02466 family)
MNRLPLFHCDVFAEANVGTEDQRKNLIDQILAEKAVSPTTARTNDRCWRSEKHWADMNWLGQYVCELADKAVEYYTSIDQSFTTPLNGYGLSVWTNVNEHGGRNDLHSHKSAVFSAVYYLQAEDTGILRFQNPSNILADCNPRSPFTREFCFNPVEGDLILWPAWVPHDVGTNFSDKSRINITFDLFFTN